MQYICGRSPDQNCVGWRELTHAEWQTKKLIFEVKLETDIKMIDINGRLAQNPQHTSLTVKFFIFASSKIKLPQKEFCK
tara:strand:- start:257 stop:493 length:237 start_codon:yes stop_codon:yes gene_type:complete